LRKAVSEVVEAGEVDTTGSGEWWSLRMERCWRQGRRSDGGARASKRGWRRGERRRSMRVEVSQREEECMCREVAVASSGSGTLRVSSRAVEARLDVSAENF